MAASSNPHVAVATQLRELVAQFDAKSQHALRRLASALDVPYPTETAQEEYVELVRMLERLEKELVARRLDQLTQASVQGVHDPHEATEKLKQQAAHLHREAEDRDKSIAAAESILGQYVQKRTS